MNKAWKSGAARAACMAGAFALLASLSAICAGSAHAAEPFLYPATPYYPTTPYAPHYEHRTYTGYYFTASSFCWRDPHNIDNGFAQPAYDSRGFAGYVCR